MIVRSNQVEMVQWTGKNEEKAIAFGEKYTDCDICMKGRELCIDNLKVELMDVLYISTDNSGVDKVSTMSLQHFMKNFNVL